MLKLKLFYLDGKDVNVEVEEKDLQEFCNCLKSNKPFYLAEGQKGFWAPESQIRFILINKEEAAQETQVAEQPQEAPQE